MPENRIIYYGIVVLIATVSLWIGAQLTKRIEWILPYTGGVAVAMIIGGFLHEWWKRRRAHPPSAPGSSKPPDAPAPQ
jgi:undecaprenyl pyrophosphate phosphatase UppP